MARHRSFRRIPPIPPDVSAQSATTIVVNPTYKGLEYRIEKGEWISDWVTPNAQGTVIFGGLTAITEYDVRARKAETETQYASGPSLPSRVTTMSDAPVDIYYVKQQTDGSWKTADIEDETPRELLSYKADKAFAHYTLTGYSTDEYKEQENERTAAKNGDTITLGAKINSLYLYYALDKHDLVFYRDIEGTEKEKTENVFYGAPLWEYSTTTPAPKEGYTFAAWSPETDQEWYRQKNGTQNENVISWYGLTMPAEGYNAYPIWVRDRLNVHLNLDDDATMDESQSTEFTVDIDEKLHMDKMNAATREGYTLDGWYTEDGVKWNADYGVTPEYCDKDEDNNPIISTNELRKYNTYSVTLTSKWNPVKVGVKYDLNGGSGEITDTNEYGLGDNITIKNAPTPPTDKSFIGWKDKNGTNHSANEIFAFDDWSVTENNIITLTAVYKEIPENSIIFDTDGGTAVEPVTGYVGSTVDLSIKSTEKTGYTFDGWYYNDEKVTNIDIGDTQKTVKAHWTANQYTITFDTNGAEEEVKPITKPYGSDIDPPPGMLTKKYYDFVGWDTEIPTTMPARNMTISALWTPVIYTITFDTDGGNEAIPNIQGTYGSVVIAPSNPTKDDFVFDGWNPEIPAYMPGENLKIKAKWKEFTATPTPNPGTTPTPTPNPGTTATPDPTGTPAPGATTTPEPAVTPNPGATSTPEPVGTPEPTATPTTSPTATPTASPSVTPTTTPRRSSGGGGGGSSKTKVTPTPSPSNTPLPSTSPVPTSTSDPMNTPIPSASPKAIPSHLSKPKFIELDPYVSGYEDGSFRTDNHLTRAELATILARLMTNKFDGYSSTFPDTKGIWSERFIGYLESYDIIKGYEDGTFRPENSVTRAEMAVMIAKVYEYDLQEPVSSADTGFSDIDDFYTEWAAASAIKQLAEDGVLSGYEDGTFHPGNAIERDEAVSIINRTIFNMVIEKITATPIARPKTLIFCEL